MSDQGAPHPRQFLHMKESEINSIPEYYRHPKLPLLFAENGHVLNRKGKPKKAIITVSPAGLFIFKPKMSDKRYKVEKEISIFSIHGIRQVDSKRREVLGKDRGCYLFMCEHVDEACACLVVSRRAMFWNLNDRDPIRLEGLTLDVPPESTLANFRSITPLRYICMCMQMKAEPDNKVLDLFSKMNVQENRTLVIEDTGTGPENIMAFVLPIVQIGKLDTIHFNGFSPFSVCRIAHFLLKKSRTITTVIFDNYQTLVPPQLRMETVTKVRQNFPVSFLFKRCSFDEPTMLTLFRELGKYKGDYQRLSFNTVPLTPRTVKALFKEVRTQKCFSTLEVMELDNIVSKSVSQEKVEKGIVGVMKHCRFLTLVSLSMWSESMNTKFNSFVDTNYLAEIHLMKQDMSQTLSHVVLPPSVHLINLSQCHFTFVSMQSLFEILAKCRNALTLVLADLDMPAAHWESLFDAFPSLPQLQCLYELDWSGNRVPQGSVQKFAKYFFEKNQLRFLAIDRVFKSMSLYDLQLLLSFLQNSSLWGLSIGGSTECNFSNNFKQFLQMLEGLKQISILHLNGQRMSDSDANALLEFLRERPSIREVSCDGSDLSGETKFYEFYGSLLKPSNIKAVGRPIMDIQRLFGRSLVSVQMHDKYEVFKKAIKGKFTASTQGMRSFFMCHPKMKDSQLFESDKFHLMTLRYPKCYFDANLLDQYRYGLGPDLSLLGEKRIFPSLRLLNTHEAVTGLGDLHRKLLPTPLSVPRYPPPDDSTGRIFGESESLGFSAFASKPPTDGPMQYGQEETNTSNEDIADIVSEMTRFGQSVQIEEREMPDPFAPTSMVGSLGQQDEYVIPALGDYRDDQNVFVPPALEPAPPVFEAPGTEPQLPVFVPPPVENETDPFGVPPVFQPPHISESSSSSSSSAEFQPITQSGTEIPTFDIAPPTIPSFVPPPPTEETIVMEPPAIPVFTPPPPVEEPPVFTPPPPVEETVVVPPVIPVFTPPPPPEEPPVFTPPPPVEDVPVFVPPPVAEQPVFAPPPPVEDVPVFVPPPVAEQPVFTPPPPVEEAPVFVPPPPVEDVPVFVPPPVAEQPVFTPPPPVEDVPVFVPPPVVEQPVFTPPPPVEDVPVFVPPPVVEQPVFTPPPPVEDVPVFVPPPVVEQPTPVAESSSSSSSSEALVAPEPAVVVEEKPDIAVVPPIITSQIIAPPKDVEPKLLAPPPMMVEPEPVEEPSYEPVRRVKRCNFPSAAGHLALPVVRASGSMPSAFPGNTVKLANNETGELPEQSPLEKVAPVNPHEPRPGIEIEDVMSFSKNAVRSEVPPVQILESQNDADVDSFYQGSPIAKPPVLAGSPIPIMNHPLMQRKKIVHPKISILGVPSEW